MAFLKELTIFIEGLANEGERALVIGGAARIDVALEHLIRRVTSHQPGGHDELFEANGPLSTFSAKIIMAYRLGLIDDGMESVLQLIRKIRNDFAHATTLVSLSESSHRNRINEIGKCAQGSVSHDQLVRRIMENSGIDLTEPPPLNVKLTAALIHIAVALEMAAQSNKPPIFVKAQFPFVKS